MPEVSSRSMLPQHLTWIKMNTAQFNQEFESNLGQLKSYLLRITASVADAEDIAQDTYIKALEKLNTFRADSSLKTWVFTIASNLAKDNLRAQKRWTENVTDISRAAALSPERLHLTDNLKQKSI